MAAEPRRGVSFNVGGINVGGAGASIDQTEKKVIVWEQDFFTADLCEALITRHGQSYGDYAFVLAQLLESMLSKTFSDSVTRGAIIKVIHALQRSDSIFRRRQSHMNWHIPFHLSRICDEICKQLHNSAVGDLHIFPFECSENGIVVITQEKQGVFTAAIVNCNPISTDHHLFNSERPPKILMQTVLEVKNIPKSRITSEAFWACNFLSECASDTLIYTHFVPWLNNSTYGQIVEEGKGSVCSTGTKSDQGNMWKAFIHAFKYALRISGVEEPQVKAVRLFIKQRLLQMLLEDLKPLDNIGHSVRLVVRAAVQNVCLSLARNGKHLSEEEFTATQELVDSIQKRVEDLPCPDQDVTAPPPNLDILTGWEKSQRADCFPLTECHRRLENVDDFIGTAVEMPRYVPVNMLRIPAKVTTFAQALLLLDETINLCNRITSQEDVVKNSDLLIISLITDIFANVLPPPLGPKSRQQRACVWNPQTILYGQQLHCMKRLWQCAEFFVWSSFAVKTTKEFDAQRIIVLGAIASISDAVIRLLAADHPSLVTQHLRGYKRKACFAPSVGRLASQTESCVVVYPELVVTRAAILDYHAECLDDTPQGNTMWLWEDGNAICKATQALLRQICQAEGFRVQSVMNYFCMETGAGGAHCVIGKFWTEFKYYRDIYIVFKWMMAPKSKLPACTSCTSCRLPGPQLEIDYHNFRIVMRYMHRDVMCKAVQLRFPSYAQPSKFTAPFEAYTEDDILHIKNLPTFDDVMGQRDSELLLSYLTAPYLRIPLILNFFATEDRVSCLGNSVVQNLLEAALFEPGKFLTSSLQEKVPLQVPSEDSNLLATPYGLLFNEFQFSPRGIIDPLLVLIRLAREMDAGTVYNRSVVDIILFLMRIAARVESYIAFVLHVAHEQKAKNPRFELRGLVFDDSQVAELADAHQSLRSVVDTGLLPMLEAWNEEVMQGVLASAENAKDIDAATSKSALLHSHVLILLRNLKRRDYTRNSTSMLLAATMFLTTRHTFNQETLPVPETELYDVMQLHRRSVVEHLYQSKPSELGWIMDSVVRVSTTTGRRTEGPPFCWGYVAGQDCVGRFTRVDEDTLQRAGFNSKTNLLEQSIAQVYDSMPTLPNKGLLSCVNEGLQDVEVNIHTLSLTFKAAHLIALPSEIAGMDDVRTVFAPKLGFNDALIRSMQCAVVQEAEHRMWVRLVGQEHDIQFWKTPDQRVALPSDAARFFPDDLAPSEDWIYPLVEPVRRAFFVRSFWQPPIFLLLPEHKLTADQGTIILAAVCSKTGRKLKEIVALKDHKTVHVYDIFSLGRRFYRRLVFTTNTHYTLRQLQTPMGDRRNPWQPWQRHCGGEFEADVADEPDQSVVILRHSTHPENVSKSVETFIPSRLLEGLIPDALLTTHRFWQDPDDNIRGYPIDNNAMHILWLHWKEVEYEPMGGQEKQHCFQIFRFARKQSAPKVSERAVLKSQKMVIADEAEEELERMRTNSTDNLDSMQREDSALIGEGMYREATTIYKPKAESATAEDYNMLLLNLVNARAGTPLHSLAQVLARIELLSHVLCWTTQVEYDSAVPGPVTLDLVVLPRLKLSFHARADADGNLQLFSLDHAHLFISNLRPPRVSTLLQGIPHSVILSDVNKNISILVPALEVVRPKITNAPFSTELIINRENKRWLQNLDTKYYLYPVHVSLSFLFTPTLASALYLLVLRFLHCEYEDVFHLASTIGTDVEFSAEEQQNFNLLRSTDRRPEASACLAKIGLLVADSPVNLCWFLPDVTALMLRSYNSIGMQCKLSESEERRLLYICRVLLKKLDILSDLCSSEKDELVDTICTRAINKTPMFEGSQSDRKAIDNFFKALAAKVRSAMDIRITRDETIRLIVVWANYRRFSTFSEYLRCIIDNRFAFLEAEAAAAETGTMQKATFRVPPLGKDELWAFYRDYDPLTVKIPDAQPKIFNSEKRPMHQSDQFDYFYCGQSVRKPGACKCKDCGEECGPNAGCPCPSCEKKNKEELKTWRHLPVFGSNNLASQKMLSFYEAFTWIENVLAQDLDVRNNLEQPTNKDTAAWDPNLRRWTMREDNNTFLRYYEMLTGTTKVRIGSGDCAKDLACLLFPCVNEARRLESAYGHLMHYLINNPQVWNKLPKYNRTGKQPLDQRLTQLYSAITAQAAINNRPVPDPPVVDPPSSSREALVAARPLTRANPYTPINTTRILPVLGNTDCNKRIWRRYDVAQLIAKEGEDLTISDETLGDLKGQPLRSAIPSGLIVFLDRNEQMLPKIDPRLPFDLRSHAAAHTTVAKNMIHRLEKDMEDFAQQENSSKFAKLSFFASDSAVRQAVDQQGEQLKSATAALNDLHERIVKLRDADAVYVTAAFEAAERTANDISAAKSEKKSGEMAFAESIMHLRRLAGQEARLGLSYLLSCLACTTAEHDWAQLNPFLTPARSEAIINVIVTALLRANRIGHLNRVAEGVKELLALLSKAQHAAHDDPEQLANMREALVASIGQKADNVASMLATKRSYIAEDSCYDPRFLIFEFTWNLVLRSRQKILIEEIFGSISNGTSIVKQMIMGAGKTTVVGPILALMLADSKNLVIQVVPPALLDFTRSILRATFSCVIQKQIFCFNCDRSSEVDSEVLSKFLHAKQSRGIVVTTPSSIKSIFLKYIEGLDRIEDTGRPALDNVEREVDDLQQVLSLWKESVLIMDEVDMLLHPLKSELNFPIGKKDELDFAPMRWRLPIHLIDALFYFHTRRIAVSLKESPEAHTILASIAEVLRMGLEVNALQAMPHLTLLNLEFYAEHLLLPMAKWLMLFLRSHHFVGLTDEETLRYITKRPSQKVDPLLNERVSKLEPDHVKSLNLSFEWLTAFLPHCLQKIDRVSFGIMNQDDMRRAKEDHPKMPRSRFVTAIPFIGKDLPSQSSEFAHPDVVIGLTVLAYRYEGLRKTDYTDIMRAVHQAVEKEVGRFHQRRTTILYNKWVAAGGGRILQSFAYGEKKSVADDEIGMQPSESIVFVDDEGDQDSRKGAKLDVLPLKLMRQANQEETDKLFRLFRRTPEVIHYYLCEHIFPEYMRHQKAKLSASGQELGGDIMFKRRIGFSGTPSDLLPYELGKCEYEPGTDGKLTHTLTSPSIMSYHVVENGWTVRSLLDRIANAQPPFHSLIDTGALITGMSNLQVAQYLLKHGLPQMEGVVFLDELDRKMILVRATGRVLKLAECGIPKVKRFAFYDQVHTTGMDIDHTPNAVAVQTLGKDMTFRDFSQGAYRMRGIGQGQRVHLMIIPEVHDLINRTLGKAKPSSPTSSRTVLMDVSAWLLVNSIRSEHVQHNQLCIQTICNVWRKEAFRALVAANSSRLFVRGSKFPQQVLDALNIYREPVDYTVPQVVPQPRMFSEAILERVSANTNFITSEDGKRVVQGIVDQTKREDEIDNPVIDVQMVQEQEEERENVEEKEKQQEIEMEKFVDLAYSRDEEAAVPWALASLRDVNRAVQFYKLSDFHLYKRRPVSFPSSMSVSRNFFNPKWSGYRRMKNVIVSMEWIPDVDAVTVLPHPYTDYGDVPEERAVAQLCQTLKLLIEHQGGLTPELIHDFVDMALGHPQAGPQDWAARDLSQAGTTDAMRELLGSNFLRMEESNRFTVALSLAEAETIRRVIHAKRLTRQPFVEGSRTAVSLNVVPANNIVLDSTPNFVKPTMTFQRERAFQCLRFFDCDLHYTEQNINFLLRSLHPTPPKQRQAFFLQTIQCRRRARQRWEKTPVSLLFNLPDPCSLLHQRTIGLCMKKELAARDIHLADAYLAINSSHSGTVAPDELWGALRFCRLESIGVDDVLDFIQVADTHHDGTLQYADFLAMLTGSREIDDEEGQPNKEDAASKHLPTIDPFGAEALKNRRAEREAIRRQLESDASREMASEDSRVRGEIEQEQMKEELALIQTSENPKLLDAALHFSFQTQDIPKLAQFYGPIKKYQTDPDFEDVKFFKFCDAAKVNTVLRSIKLINDGNPVLNQFMISIEFCLPTFKTMQGKDYKTKLLDVIAQSGGHIALCSYYTNAWYLTSPSEINRMRGGEESGEDEEEEDDYEDSDDYEETSDEDEDSDQVFYIYSAPEYTKKKRTHRIVQGEQVLEEPGQRQSNSTGANNIEWMKIIKPVEGWTPFVLHGKEYWSREVVMLSLSPTGQLVASVAPDTTLFTVPQTVFEEPKGKDDDSGSDTDSWSLWYNDWADNADAEEQEEEDEDNQFDMGDLTDLVAAIKKAKELKVGDKVTRNPQCWEGHGNEDGGEGTVGKVARTEDNRVQVQWPNGQKAQYCWGEQGKFELIKVGSADDDDDWGREIVNDDKWAHLLKKGAQQKIRCSACSGNSGNESGNGWFRCNQCPNTNLCKKCFKLLEHPEHEFTDMSTLAELIKSTDIVRGSAVRIRPDLKEPKNGWQDAPRDGTPGTVTDLDDEVGTVTVSFNDEPWFGMLTEIVVVNLKAEEYATTWLGTLVNAAQVTKKEAPRLVLVVDQQLTPPVVEGKFTVGQKVKAVYPPNNRWYPGEVRAVLPQGRYHIVYDDNDSSDKVTEEQIRLNPFVRGARVRLKGTTNDEGDVQFSIGLQKGVKAGMIGEVIELSTHSYGSQALRLRVKIRNGMKVMSQPVLDSEVELVGEAKWLMQRHNVDSDGNVDKSSGEPQPIPKSAAPLIDRAFSDGVESTDVYIRDATYVIKFETWEIINPKTHQVIGTLIRDPPQEWSKQREKFCFDDGKWHVVSILVQEDAENGLIAFCDGKPVHVDYDGPTYDEDSDEEGDEEEETEEDSASNAGGDEPVERPESDKDYARRARLLDFVDLWTRALVQHKPDTDVGILDRMILALESPEVVCLATGTEQMKREVTDTSAAESKDEGGDQPAGVGNDAADDEAPENEESDNAADDVAEEDDVESEENEEKSEDSCEDEEREAEEGDNDTNEEPPYEEEEEASSSGEAKHDKKPAVTKAAGDGSDKSDEDDSSSTASSLPELSQLKRKPIEVLSLDVRTPVGILSFPQGMLDTNVRQKLGPDFPVRRIGKVYFSWGKTANEDLAKQVFTEIDKTSQWSCKHCNAKNSRLLDACTGCQRDRVEDDSAKNNKRTKVRVALPKSKEAQEVRKKMHARLRAQYQKQLESLEDIL